MNPADTLDALAAEVRTRLRMVHKMLGDEIASKIERQAAQLRQRESEAVAEVARESMWGERCVHWIRNDNDDGKDLLMGTKLYLGAPSDDAALRAAMEKILVACNRMDRGARPETCTSRLGDLLGPIGSECAPHRALREVIGEIARAALAQNAPKPSHDR